MIIPLSVNVIVHRFKDVRSLMVCLCRACLSGSELALVGKFSDFNSDSESAF